MTVAGEVTGKIERGLLVLLGVAGGDTDDDARQLAQKIVELRIFPDDEGKMNRSLLEASGALLVVSQFTLYGNTEKGRRPSWIDAARPEHAEPLVDRVVTRLRELGATVATGRFRTEMQVTLTNDGPVTIWLQVNNSADADLR